MTKGRLESIALAYWEVGTALRHPDAPACTTSHALRTLNESDRLRPTESRLSEEMHTLRYDIIEGNQEWRTPDGNKQKVQGSALILPMRR